MANNTCNLWISNIQQSGTWNIYDGFKPEKCKNQPPVNYKHKSVVGCPNRVLHFEIVRSTVKITTHVLYSILVIHGEILRIVVYRKFRQLKAFVEFSKEEFATKVIDGSNHIVLDYITLKAEYGKPSSVIVTKNDELSWDYSKSPLLKYVNGLPTLKSIVAVLKDSPQKNRKIAENDKTWELVENYDFIKPDDKSIAPGKSSTKQIITTANSKTRKTLLAIPISEEFSILSVRGLDPAKSNCNRLFRLLSMYATVSKIHYLRELKSAEVHISKCNDINMFAQVQQHYLSHGFNLSFQYFKREWMLKNRSIDPFILPDGSPSHVVYDRKMKPHVLCPPSRVLQFEGAPPSMNEMKLIALLKRTIKIEDFKVKVTTPKDPKNCSTIRGEIWFSSASVAIEVVMAINYAIFWNKDSNKKKYVLKLSFISEVLPILKAVVPKKENNKAIKIEDNKAIKTEDNKRIKTEDFKAIENENNKIVKTEDFKAIENENNKKIKTEDFKAVETEDNKIIITEDFKAIENEYNKRIKIEDFKAIENENNKRIKTEDFKAIENENNKRIKTEDFKAIENEENKIIKTEDFKAIENEYNKRIKTDDSRVIENEENKIIKTEDFKAFENEYNKRIKTDDSRVIENEENKIIKTEDFKAFENEYNKRIKTDDSRVIENEENKIIITEDFKAIENEYNERIKTEDFKAIENEYNKRIKTDDSRVIENEENKIIKTEDFKAFENEYNKRIKTEDFKAIENEYNKRIKTADFKAIENENNKKIKTEDFKAIENEYNKRIKTDDSRVIENEENKIIKTEDFKAFENEYNKRIKTEDFKAIENENNKRIKTDDSRVIENENNKIIKTEGIDAIIMEDNKAIKTECSIVIKTEVD